MENDFRPPWKVVVEVSLNGNLRLVAYRAEDEAYDDSAWRRGGVHGNMSALDPDPEHDTPLLVATLQTAATLGARPTSTGWPVLKLAGAPWWRTPQLIARLCRTMAKEGVVKMPVYPAFLRR